jgi:transposase
MFRGHLPDDVLICERVLKTVRLRMDIVDNAITNRLEVFTGTGRRRTWSDEDKARIVAEIAVSGASVSAVARRHGLSPQQLFGWRRQLQAAQHAEELQFVPAVLDVAPSSPSLRRQRKMPRCPGPVQE